jgi:hypothetical protein
MLVTEPGRKNIKSVTEHLRKFNDIRFRITYGSNAGEKNILFPGTKISLKIKWTSGNSSDQILTSYTIPWSGFIRSMFTTAFAVGLLFVGLLIFAAAAFFFWRKKSGSRIDSVYGTNMPPPPNLAHPLSRTYPQKEKGDEKSDKKETVYDLTDILNGRSNKIFSTAREDLRELPEEIGSGIEAIDRKTVTAEKYESEEEEEPGDTVRAAIIYEANIEKEKLKNDPSNALREKMDEKKAILLKRYAYDLLQTALRNARPYKNAALVLAEEKLSREYDLFMDSTVLGSGRWSNIHINDRTVSPVHARIKRVGNKYVLYDMISETGTYLNGKKLLRPRPLSDGDTIKIGRTELYFRGMPVEDL